VRSRIAKLAAVPQPEFATNDSSGSARRDLALTRLQNPAVASERETAWAEFLAVYSGTLLHVCRSVAHDRDLAMDAYAFVIEALRADDCRRLQAYVPEPNIRFTSWLIVVTRRLVLDFVRQRYGRPRSTDVEHRQEQETRRRLEDLICDEIDPDDLAPESEGDADAMLRRRELLEHLHNALNQLSASDQLLLALRFDDDRTVSDIARILGLPSIFHVYRRLKAVLSGLRARLRDRGIEESEP